MFELTLQTHSADGKQRHYRSLSTHSTMTDANRAFERHLLKFQDLFGLEDGVIQQSGMKAATWFAGGKLHEANLVLEVLPFDPA